MAEEPAGLLTTVHGDDQVAFGAAVEPHRRELRVHCYRFLASYDDAEDAVQETYLRAWRHRQSFEGRATLRAWLYRIATNTCLDELRRRKRRPIDAARAGGSRPDPTAVPWLQPFPDALLDLPAESEHQPEAVVTARESVSLAFLVAVQLLPPRQRAVLLLRDVMALAAAETAELLEVSVPTANSALQRARATMARHREQTPDTPTAQVDDQDRAIAARFTTAHESADPDLIIEVLRADARLTINPVGMVWEGKDAIVPDLVANMTALGTWRCLVVRSNGQPAVANYLRRHDDDTHRPFTLTVLETVDGSYFYRRRNRQIYMLTESQLISSAETNYGFLKNIVVKLPILILVNKQIMSLLCSYPG